MFLKLRSALLVFVALLGINTTAQTYCTTGLYTTGCSDGDQILALSIGSWTSPSSAPCSTGGYGNYTSDTLSLYQGSVSLATVTHGPTYSQGDAIWIDFNDDGDFADAGEHIWSSTGYSLLNSDYITIPVGAALGNHRLRVRCIYNSVVSASQSCSSTTYGEVEDYTVTITTPPPCPPPIYLTVNSITANSVTIGYTSTGAAFDIEYGPAGFTLGTGSTSRSSDHCRRRFASD